MACLPLILYTVRWVPLLIWSKASFFIRNSSRHSYCSSIFQTRGYPMVLCLILLLLLYRTVCLLIYHACLHLFHVLFLTAPLLLYPIILILSTLLLPIILSKHVSRVSWCFTHHNSSILHDMPPRVLSLFLLEHYLPPRYIGRL